MKSNSAEWLEKLKWGTSLTDFETALDYWKAQDLEEIAKLLPPSKEKEYWEGGAVVVCALSDDDFLQLLPRALIWLQDMNWPGSFDIFERVKAISVSKRGKARRIVEEKMREAEATNDDEWVSNLKLLHDELKVQT